MPAGKMILAAKASRPFRNRRRRSNFKKAVTAIAKKTLMTQAETKTGTFTWSGAFGANGSLQPVWNSVLVGTGQNNRIGDEIHARGVRLRGFVNMDTSIITGLQDFVGVRFLIASSKRPLTSGDFPTYNGAIDPEVFNVISDRYINFSTTKRCLYFTKYIKYNRKVRYQGTAVNKGELYLFLVPNGGTGLTTTTGCTLNLGVQMYYKDI